MEKPAKKLRTWVSEIAVVAVILVGFWMIISPIVAKKGDCSFKDIEIQLKNVEWADVTVSVYYEYSEGDTFESHRPKPGNLYLPDDVESKLTLRGGRSDWDLEFWPKKTVKITHKGVSQEFTITAMSTREYLDADDVERNEPIRFVAIFD